MSTQVKQPQLDPNVYYHAMGRQALINGNFDFIQRLNITGGVALVSWNSKYAFDRWKVLYALDGGTAPATWTLAQVGLTPGTLDGSFYKAQIACDGAGSGFGANSGFYLDNAIENGVRYLAGIGTKYLTVSFWAKSDVVGKRIGLALFQNYGTGGTPTTAEAIKGEVWTLSSSWAKYTYTFALNTLVGKTFGTALDDRIEVCLWSQWGTGFGGTYVKTGVTAESWVGAGSTEISQVQVNSGTVALPFMPKNHAQELSECQRYFEKSYSENIALATGTDAGYIGIKPGNNTSYLSFPSTVYKAHKRFACLPVVYSPVTGSTALARDYQSASDKACAVGVYGTGSFSAYINNVAVLADAFVAFHFAAEADF